MHDMYVKKKSLKSHSLIGKSRNMFKIIRNALLVAILLVPVMYILP